MYTRKVQFIIDRVPVLYMKTTTYVLRGVYNCCKSYKFYTKSLLHVHFLQTALNMLCKLLHNELKDKGVHVGCLHPGWVQTDMGTTKAPLTISQSVCGCLQVMSKMNAENACVLTDYTGKPLPWWSGSLKRFLREFHGYLYSQQCIIRISFEYNQLFNCQ